MILIGNCDKVLSVNKQNGIVTCILFKTEKEKKKKVAEEQEEQEDEEVEKKKQKTDKKKTKDVKIIDYTLVGDLCDVITSPLLTFEIEVEEKKKNSNNNVYYELIKIIEIRRPNGGITVEYIKKKAKDSSMFYLKGVSTKERNKRITSTFDKISTLHGISPKTSTITDASLLRCVLTNSNENTLNQFNLDTRYFLRNLFKSDMFFTTFCTNLGVIFMMKMQETEEDILCKKDINECILLIKRILFNDQNKEKIPFSVKTIDFLIEYLEISDNNIKEQLEGIRLGNNLHHDVIYNEKVRLNSVMIKQKGTGPYDINDSTMVIIETCCTNSIRMTSSPGVRDVYLQTVFTFELERQFIRAITSSADILEHLELINVQKDNLYEERNNEYITFLRKIEARKTSIIASVSIPESTNKRYQLTDSQKIKLKEDSIRTSNTIIIAPARKIYNLRKNFENCNILDFDSLFKPSTVTLERWPKDQNGKFKVKQDAIDYLMNQLGIQIITKPNIMDDNSSSSSSSNRRVQPYVIIIEWCNSYSTRELITALDIIHAATLSEVGIDKMRNRQLEKIYLSGNINCYPESPGKPFTDLYRAIDCHGKNVKLNNFNTFSDNDPSPFSLYFANVDDLYNHFDISKGSGKVHSSSIDFICNCYRKSNELPPPPVNNNNNNNKRKHSDDDNEEEEYNNDSVPAAATTTTFPILDKWNALTFKSFSSLKYVDPPREYVIVNLKCKDITSNELEKAIFCSPSRKANFIALGTPNDYKRIIVENSGVSRKRYYQRDRESCLEIDLSWNFNNK